MLEIINSFRQVYQYKNRPREGNETPAETQILDEMFARQARLQPAANILTDLEQAAWEVEVITDEEVMPLVIPFGEVLRELNIAIYLHFNSQLQISNLPPGASVNPAYVKDTRERTELIYASEPDRLNQRVDSALEALEQKLRKYIR